MELISLYAETQNVQVNNARRFILNLRYFVNAIEYSVQNLILRRASLKIHINLYYSSFDSRYA